MPYQIKKVNKSCYINIYILKVSYLLINLQIIIIIIKKDPSENHLPPSRLLTLIKQALAYQVESSRYHPKVKPKITT